MSLASVAPLFTQGGGSSASSSSRSGDLGNLDFGGFGGLTFNNQGIDQRWLIGGAVVAAVLIFALLARGR